MLHFVAEADPTESAISRIAETDAINPFYTYPYSAYRAASDFQPWIFKIADDDSLQSGCVCFMKRGRLSTLLDIPSLPALGGAAEAFWKGVMVHCARHRVTDLAVQSFASSEAKIPRLVREDWRKTRCEYRIGLGNDLWERMRKGHSYSVKKARKSGLVLSRGLDKEACLAHQRLVHGSLTRRQQRGESVVLGEEGGDVERLLRSGCGQLFQALQDGVAVASNLILLSAKGAYNHSQGANEKGLATGAPHFLIRELVEVLKRDHAIEVFNIGGTDQLNSGLEQFKSGFGVTTSRLELEAAQFTLQSGLRAMLRSSVRRLQTIVGRG
jgi:hypothetical protein